MNDAVVRELARLAGIATDWVDALDQPRRVEIASLRAILSALGFPCDTAADLAESRARLTGANKPTQRPLITATVGHPITLTDVPADRFAAGEIIFEDGQHADVKLQVSANGTLAMPAIDRPGYHRLHFAGHELTLAAAPRQCVSVGDIAPGERLWGLAVQLYALRREGIGGIGDTTALRALAASAAQNRADAIALSPVHSLFPADPSKFSPYSPSSRLFLNPLLADPADVFGAARLAQLSAPDSSGPDRKDAKLIDWPQAARRKFDLLSRLYDDFVAKDLQHDTALARTFRAFTENGGGLLRQHAVFEALHAKWFGAETPLWNWRDWPADWRDPGSEAVARYAAGERRTIEFQIFLQWIADRSFAAAQADARHAGMRIGLISDLAIGMDRGGSHAWARQNDLLLGLNIGAPPDALSARGQDWGLTGFSPQALVESGFEPFLATLRAALRHAGGVRIDHAMGLMRLWLIPHGASPADGAYLTYPLDDLLRLVALESHRHRAIVIGEDLGTVPPEFRHRMAETGISGMDVLWFQRNKTGYLPPSKWRPGAVAMTSTHDLPTVAGWWSGADIATREKLGLVSDASAERRERAANRRALWTAFKKAKAAAGTPPGPEETDPVADSALRFVGKAAAPLALIPLEDVLGLRDQPNLPGTIDEHPNWRRRYGEPAQRMLDKPDVQQRLKGLRESRR
ncbi:MAG: 4-alpha-glucanotransferase [Alphaproteobacteria bacterium]|nr:MAG: 4-alpha-glucanotransferase [Alphaproteobacteria bacterium]